MLPSQQKDLFGNSSNQVQNYDKFRPVYPKEFTEIILNNLQSRNSFLDVACGTGQLLFDLNSSFVRSVGIDISPQQIKVTQQKIIDKSLTQSVSAHVCDAHSLESIQKDNNLPLRYDLVTIGQALHWFDVNTFLKETSENILVQNDGLFAVAGYFCKGIDFATDINNDQKVESGDAIYDSYYDTVKSYFDCDRDNLSRAYQDYNFSQYFKEVEGKQFTTSTPCSLFEVFKYMKTYSAYNTFLEANKSSPDFVDPAEVFQKAVAERIEAIQKQQGQAFENPLRLKTFYFLRLFKRL